MHDLPRTPTPVALLASLLLAACSPDPDPPADDEPVSASRDIDSAGGTVGLDNRVELEFPEGALESSTEIVVTRTTKSPPSKYDPKSNVFTFEPSGLEFTEPVVVRFQHDGLSDERTIFWSDDDAEEYAALGATDEDSTTLRGTVTHFSRGFVGTRLECREDADCPASNRCQNGRCRGASCGDDVANGEETDVDCGGPVCDPCGAGDACDGDDDCATGRCSDGTCRREGFCESDADCAAGQVCIAGECAPSTTDASDVDDVEPRDATDGETVGDVSNDDISEADGDTRSSTSDSSLDATDGDAETSSADGCSSDADCSGDQVCVNESCVEGETSS